MPWVDVNGSDIFYHEEGEGQPLVFLHGVTSRGEAGIQQVEAFRTRFRVIRHHSVNHGRSTATRIEALRHPRTPTAANPSRGELAGLISKVTSPMLIVVGGLDRALPAAQYLHELVAGSRLTVIDGAPHNVYWEAAEEYNAAVSQFLDEVLA